MTTHEETLDSIPNEVVAEVFAEVLQNFVTKHVLFMDDDEGHKVSMSIGEIEMTQLGKAKFTVTAMLGEESREWVVRIGAESR